MDAETRLTEGLELFRGGDAAGAAALFEKVVSEEPSNTRALAYLEYLQSASTPLVLRLDDLVGTPGTLPPLTAPPPTPTTPPARTPTPPPAAAESTPSADATPAEEAKAGDSAPGDSAKSDAKPPEAAPTPKPSEATAAAGSADNTPPRSTTVDPDQGPSGPWDAINSTPGTSVAQAVPPDPTGNANADGLNGMWSDAVAAAIGPTAASTPWDEGPSVSATVDLDRGPPPTATPQAARSPTPSSARMAAVEGPGDLASQCRALMVKVKEHHDLGDFSGSLEHVMKVLELDPANAEARDYLEKNQDTLLKMYGSKLGSLESVPRLQMSPDQVIWLNLHHKAGFLLSRVDGHSTFEDILSMSAMGRLETMRILVQLVEAGVIRT